MPTIIHLGQDVLVKVLSSCDVYTVLCVSQVNRYLRIISMTKQIWIFLIQTLQSCSIIALPPGTELGTCSTEELVKMVKRTITGPRTLACTSLLPPTIFHEVVLPAESLITREEYHYPIVKLVGGRCVVLVRRESLEVWDIFTQRKIYNHQGRTDWPTAELARESIILGFIYRNEDNFETVEIRQIDLRSMDDALQAKITIRGYTSAGWYISGDFAAITLGSSVVLFVNWREQTAVLLGDVPPWQVDDVGFMSGHVIILSTTHNPEPPQEACLTVYSIADFAEFWAPISQLDFTQHVSFMRISPVRIEVPKRGNEPFRVQDSPYLRILPSPTRENTYHVVLGLGEYTPGDYDFRDPPGAVFYFLCTTSDSSNNGESIFYWQSRATELVCHRPGNRYTYTGQMVDWVGNVVHGPTIGTYGRIILTYLDPEDLIVRDISPDGCVLASVMPDGLRVSWYE
ncbi:hypothetical protein K438DRAFT_1833556 [Mycena galopus ATCC 62051]|nr:hypothetical protein K438DRAFT_1833556 [Mycena galopus ATCC 62051]